jgi:hypothetical protein
MKALTLFEIIIIILFEVNFILKYKNKKIKLKKKAKSSSRLSTTNDRKIKFWFFYL